jgi:hypothetical protein
MQTGLAATLTVPALLKEWACVGFAISLISALTGSSLKNKQFYVKRTVLC